MEGKQARFKPTRKAKVTLQPTRKALTINEVYRLIDEARRIRDTSRYAELEWWRNKHAEIFGRRPSITCPPSLVQSRVYYKLYLEACIRDKVQASDVVKMRARAVLQMRDDYEGIDDEMKSLSLTHDTLYQQQKENQMAKKTVNKEATTVNHETETQETAGGFGKARLFAFGRPVTTAIRGLGALGYTAANIRTIMEKLEVPVAPATISTQLYHVRAGRMEGCDFTKTEQAEIKKLAGEGPVAKPAAEPAAPAPDAPAKKAPAKKLPPKKK